LLCKGPLVTPPGAIPSEPGSPARPVLARWGGSEGSSLKVNAGVAALPDV